MVLIGDIHGTFRTLVKEIENGTEKNIIQVGDFGLGFRTRGRDLEFLRELDGLLKEKGKKLYVLRGNHDDPSFWNGQYDDSFENIDLVTDYSIVTIEGYKVLFVGGALSIDRKQRAKGVDYWEGEEFQYEEDVLLDSFKQWGNPDIVVTHTAPSLCYPREFNDLVYSFARLDSTLLTDLSVERSLVDRLYDVVRAQQQPKYWVYGHFHSDRQEERDGTKFILLGIGSTINLKD